jgi:Ser/Thr protein kinase RdoA (MazF antagonist)
MHRIFESLVTPPPEFSADRAAELLEQHYGIRGDLSPVVSERDQNFRVRSADGTPYILKFANIAEPEDVTDFQNQALLHIARVRPDFPVPRVIATGTGEYLVRTPDDSGIAHSMRLLSWLAGTPLQHAEGVDSIAGQTGTCLAELGLILRDYEHVASEYPLLWDIRNASHLADLLAHVNDADLRSLCEERLQRFADVVRPRLELLRTQVVHNDLNPSNMLVADDDVNRLTGVIDFGDMVHTQLVNDVAVAAAYFCRLEDDPYREVVDFLATYSATLPLTGDEIDILPDMILTRHLTTIMITHWRASLYPENRDYILRNEGRARNMLRKVAGLPIDATRMRFHGVCTSTASAEAAS